MSVMSLRGEPDSGNGRRGSADDPYAVHVVDADVVVAALYRHLEGHLVDGDIALDHHRDVDRPVGSGPYRSRSRCTLHTSLISEQGAHPIRGDRARGGEKLGLCREVGHQAPTYFCGMASDSCCSDWVAQRQLPGS